MNVAEGGLQEINNLLLDLQALVGATANEAGISAEEKDANQLQIDSILQTIDRLANAQIDQLAFTDTIPLSPEARKRLPNVSVLPISEMIGEAIRRIHFKESVSSLFMK